MGLPVGVVEGAGYVPLFVFYFLLRVKDRNVVLLSDWSAVCVLHVLAYLAWVEVFGGVPPVSVDVL